MILPHAGTATLGRHIDEAVVRDDLHADIGISGAVAHLRENIAAASMVLPYETMGALDIAASREPGAVALGKRMASQRQ
jgi:hypothetical protein